MTYESESRGWRYDWEVNRDKAAIAKHLMAAEDHFSALLDSPEFRSVTNYTDYSDLTRAYGIIRFHYYKQFEHIPQSEQVPTDGL